uniref:G-protein coupled receptors family 1 profile domain-containing protein n=1 Tax=Xenopus tropicalis TaxID=8364 RepID=A0A803KCD6_XENTR
MGNPRVLYSNDTDALVQARIVLNVKTGLVVLTLLCFMCFLYTVAAILHIFCTSPHLRENARYVLFAHMLINDTTYLASGLFLFLGAIYGLYLPVSFCYFLYTVGTVTFRVTPYNLAVMSLERYVAICYPLRQGQLVTVRKGVAAIAGMWTLGLIPNLADFITFSPYFEKFPPIICTQGTLTVRPEQSTIRLYTLTLTFALVALVILFTYVKVFLVARSIGSDKSSALKASKTVMLHAFQLLLCMTSLLASLVETYPFNFIKYLPLSSFLLFTCLPRFLCPLIYGLRDEKIRKYVKKMHSAKR